VVVRAWKYIPGDDGLNGDEPSGARRLVKAAFWRIRNAAVGRVLARLRGAYAVSESLCGLLREHGVRCDGAIHNGIELDDWPPPAQRRAPMTAGSAPGPVVLLAGRLSYCKGINELVAALAIVRRRLPSARLLSVGAG